MVAVAVHIDIADHRWAEIIRAEPLGGVHRHLVWRGQVLRGGIRWGINIGSWPPTFLQIVGFFPAFGHHLPCAIGVEEPWVIAQPNKRDVLAGQEIPQGAVGNGCLVEEAAALQQWPGGVGNHHIGFVGAEPFQHFPVKNRAFGCEAIVPVFGECRTALAYDRHNPEVMLFPEFVQGGHPLFRVGSADYIHEFVGGFIPIHAFFWVAINGDFFWIVVEERHATVFPRW